MEKAILSRINLQLQDTHIAQEYFDTISDLIDTQEVQALKKMQPTHGYISLSTFPVFRGLHHECLEAILRKS